MKWKHFDVKKLIEIIKWYSSSRLDNSGQRNSFQTFFCHFLPFFGFFGPFFDFFFAFFWLFFEFFSIFFQFFPFCTVTALSRAIKCDQSALSTRITYFWHFWSLFDHFWPKKAKIQKSASVTLTALPCHFQKGMTLPDMLHVALGDHK